MSTPYIRFMRAAREREDIYEIMIASDHMQLSMIDGQTAPSILEWCEENCSDLFLLYPNYAMFLNPGDAAMFKLVWG